MKNLHVLPTDNYSPLVHSINKYGGYFKSEHYSPMKEMGDSYQNIYITNDEEIKEGDWWLNRDDNKIYHNIFWQLANKAPSCKKIILTTDQDLIKDGVQAIDDEFLEWFVNNPGCEEVEVENIPNNNWGFDLEEPMNLGYKIIIPKEEPKQYPIGGYAPGFYSCICVTCKTHFQGDKRACQCEPCAVSMTKEEPKQETLEEAAEKWNEQQTTLEFGKPHNAPNRIKAFIAGAKWQAERMYSEEEVLNILFQWSMYGVDIELDKLVDKLPSILPYNEWFEQFKKK